MEATTASSSDTLSTATAVVPTSNNDYLRWVDYLPGQLASASFAAPTKVGKQQQRSSMDPSETNMTVTNSVSCQDEDARMEEDWPDSNSLEGYSMLPHYLLVEQDPLLQHELALAGSRHTSYGGDDPSVAPELFANSLEELLEQRRVQLAASMQASMRTRQFLEPHIRQRAGLSNVLSQIERSSWTIQEHLFASSNNNNSTSINDEQLPPAPEVNDGSAACSNNNSVMSDNHSVNTSDTCNSVDMTGVVVTDALDDGDDDDDAAFAASVLNDPDDCLL